MFCYQCEQASKGVGCSAVSVCGKTPDVAALQDLLVHALQGLALYATEGLKVGVRDREAGVFTVKALFSTLTNVNFDPDAIVVQIRDCVALRDKLAAKVSAAGGNTAFSEGPAVFKPEATMEGLVRQGDKVGPKSDVSIDPDILSLHHTVLYGIKGVSAYADHSRILGKEDDAVYDYLHEALASMTRRDLSLNDWVGLALKCGEINLKAMELLDAANTGTYGHPVPTPVPLGAKKGKAILVSGHDLKDLEEILKQSEGKGVNVYTHGEMLPAHAYPGLKKYSHFYGHYGTAWQNQQKEFAQFPGAIMVTTNCLQEPDESYKANVFTGGRVGWPGVTHISDGNYAPLIEKALALPGFAADMECASVLTGFARNTVMSVADKVIDAVKNNHIKHFFLVAGCDGAKPGRNYYTEFVEKVPDNCVVLTLACGKFRFFDKQLGDIGGIPRLLDVGQCNDAYSAIQIAVALSKAFNVGVNDLPLSLVLSWYEQKAVAILLTLLYLGIKDIRLGPSLPAFLTPNVVNFLVQNFNIMPISTPDADLKAILGDGYDEKKAA
ncbi:MAG: hydroxylamine reductase [Alphaproteobacteria bacterium]|uniref:Hydroxylamine reductase n=1 Tax=Candidatus Nitrobium versatile TaxID=2884831 RepID=A0A953M1Y5_9BACT|nr:hydroxylamine reductase [Candidatus Nitrobium versatile]